MRPRRAWSEEKIQRFAGTTLEVASDPVAIEEPLELVLADEENSVSLATLLRTPGEDFELIAGFLFSEGLVNRSKDITSMSYCTRGGEQTYNVVRVRLAKGIPPGVLHAVRHVATHSGCGLCSKTSFDPGEMCNLAIPETSSISLDPDWLTQLPGKLRRAQHQFKRTGGVHGAALCSYGGDIRSLCEDVGRHNAVDKLIGKELLSGTWPVASEQLLLLSGRAGFELIQKAARARIQVIASLGAPTSLSVEWARKSGIVLIGFLSEARFNIYSGAQRLS